MSNSRRLLQEKSHSQHKKLLKPKLQRLLRPKLQRLLRPKQLSQQRIQTKRKLERRQTQWQLNRQSHRSTHHRLS